MAKYVTDPAKIKFLLLQCPTLETMLANLIIELEVIYKQGTGIICSSDEIMLAMANGAKPLSDMPFAPSSAGEKLTDIITSYQKILDDEYGIILQSIRNDIFLINSVVEKVNNAIERLPPEQKEIILLKYWQKRSWGQIADTMRISPGQVKDWHKIAVEQHMCKVLKISFDTYNYVIEKVR